MSTIAEPCQLGIKAEYYGGDNWDAPEFLTAAGEAANGAFFVDPSEPKGDKFLVFSKKYKKRYDKEPDINAAFGYDALIAIAEAIRLARDLTGVSIQKALYQVSFKGISGKIEFNKNGDLRIPTFDRNVIRDGKKVIINR